MLSYFTLHDMYPEEWEIDLIRLLDRIVLDKYIKEAKEAEQLNNS